MQSRAFLRNHLPESVVRLYRRAKYWGLPEPLRTARVDSLISTHGLCFLQEVGRRLNEDGVGGDFVECGVYKGGSATLLAAAIRSASLPRRLFLYDAFAGMPRANPVKDDAASQALEKRFVGDERLTRKSVGRYLRPGEYEIAKGWFSETFQTLPMGPIALLHIDCDFYDPVKLCLETFYDRVVSGGYIIIDDYGAYEGCRRATDEFIARHALPLRQVDLCVFYIQKP